MSLFHSPDEIGPAKVGRFEFGLAEIGPAEVGPTKFEFRTFLGLKEVTANAAGPTPPDFFDGVPTQ
jgi:hypothetical protein